MQAVILCAGKGTRMGNLTKDTPKPLLKINGKTLIEHKLDRLPEDIDEIILVIGYKGEQIRERFGNSYNGIKIIYVEDKTISGTAHALWQAKGILSERFIVMMGDDIYPKSALESCLKYKFAIACIKADRETTGSRIILNKKGYLDNFVTHKMYIKLKKDGGFIFTGLYTLTKEIFNYKPVKLDLSCEYGLPQTLLEVAKDHKIEIVEINNWISISNQNDLEKASSILQKELL